MITLIKFGGSLITDKTVQSSYKEAVVARLSAEIEQARQSQPNIKIIVGHGSGSFGHFEAKKHGTMAGVQTSEEWLGFSSVAVAASQLSQYVAQTMLSADLPVFRIQPSASVIAENGTIQSMTLESIKTALQNGLVPLVHGDVAFDTIHGGTIISTETIFAYLAKHLQVNRIILLGDETGVYDQTGETIPHITPTNLEQYKTALGGSGGVDVTGGMYTKVIDMLNLAQLREGLQIRVMYGAQPRLLKDTLLGTTQTGTLITAS